MWCIIFAGKSTEEGRNSWDKKHHHTSLSYPIAIPSLPLQTFMNTEDKDGETNSSNFLRKEKTERVVLLSTGSFTAKWQVVRLKGFQINLARSCQNLTLQGQNRMKWEFLPHFTCIGKCSFVYFCFANLFSLQSSIWLTIIGFHQWSLYVCLYGMCHCVYVCLPLPMSLSVYLCLRVHDMCVSVCICMYMCLCVYLSMLAGVDLLLKILYFCRWNQQGQRSPDLSSQS